MLRDGGAKKPFFGERHACSHGKGKGAIAIALNSFYMWNLKDAGQDAIMFLGGHKYRSLWLSWLGSKFKVATLIDANLRCTEPEVPKLD